MAKPKAVNWTLINNQSEDDIEIYTLMSDLMMKFHDEVKGAVIILMWRHNLKLDPDNYIDLADVQRTNDKFRELREHDFIIGLNKDAWSFLDDQQKLVVVDSQLERIALSKDKEGEAKEDDRSRVIYRLKKEQVVDEETLVRRHGLAFSDVMNHVCERMTTVDAEEGSHVANVLEGSGVKISGNAPANDADELSDMIG